MHIGDHVTLKPEALHGQRRDLAGEIGRVGDVWLGHGGERCTVVYEARQSLLCDVPASNFEPVAAEVIH